MLLTKDSKFRRLLIKQSVTNDNCIALSINLTARKQIHERTLQCIIGRKSVTL
jgi:hypothetical protein